MAQFYLSSPFTLTGGVVTALTNLPVLIPRTTAIEGEISVLEWLK